MFIILTILWCISTITLSFLASLYIIGVLASREPEGIMGAGPVILVAWILSSILMMILLPISWFVTIVNFSITGIIILIDTIIYLINK